MPAKRMPPPSLKSVKVRHGRSFTFGLLYFRSRTHVVLLNNLVDSADLGPLRHVRKNYIENEATIAVIPVTPDVEIIQLEPEQ